MTTAKHHDSNEKNKVVSREEIIGAN